MAFSLKMSKNIKCTTRHYIYIYIYIYKIYIRYIYIYIYKQEDQTISRVSLILLAECVLKKNVFEHNMRYFKQLHGTAIRTKFAPPYTICYFIYGLFGR